jgi:hypothetical protein
LLHSKPLRLLAAVVAVMALAVDLTVAIVVHVVTAMLALALAPLQSSPVQVRPSWLLRLLQ